MARHRVEFDERCKFWFCDLRIDRGQVYWQRGDPRQLALYDWRRMGVVTVELQAAAWP